MTFAAFFMVLKMKKVSIRENMLTGCTLDNPLIWGQCIAPGEEVHRVQRVLNLHGHIVTQSHESKNGAQRLCHDIPPLFE